MNIDIGSSLLNTIISSVRVLHITVEDTESLVEGVEHSKFVLQVYFKMKIRDWDMLLKLRCRVEVITRLQFLTVNSLEILNSVNRRQLLLYIHYPSPSLPSPSLYHPSPLFTHPSPAITPPRDLLVIVVYNVHRSSITV